MAKTDHESTPRRGHSTATKLTAGAAALFFVFAPSGCALPGAPAPEHQGGARVYTVPGKYALRLVGTVVDARPGVTVEYVERTVFDTPEEAAELFAQYGEGTLIVYQVQAFIDEPIPPGKSVKLHCDVVHDGQVAREPFASDEEIITEASRPYLGVLCTFSEALIPEYNLGPSPMPELPPKEG